jgi:hypothetical protein
MTVLRTSPGFAAPILWGARNGWSRTQIAEGLGLDENTVEDVLVEHVFPEPGSTALQLARIAKRTGGALRWSSVHGYRKRRAPARGDAVLGGWRASA